MSAREERRHHFAARFGVAGAALGVASGFVQATAGTNIPNWTGAKASPVALGLLTVGLCLVAGLAAAWQRRPGLTVGSRAVSALGMLVPGLLCFTTVGRLWFLPGPLLLVASALTVSSWRGTAAWINQNWSRCLVTALGAAELLMAAGATPQLLAVGAVGGIALVAAAWLHIASPAILVGLVAVGTVPFAVLAWTAVVPVLLLVAAAAVAAPIVHHASAERVARRRV